MENKLTVAELIKRHIKMRGKTVKEVAADLDKNYTTFCGILNRDAVDAKLLFELANLLDIDLAWMTQLFDHRKPVSSLAPYQMPRMRKDFRDHDYPDVCRTLDDCIKNNLDSIADTRRELLSLYPNVFYVLDVLLPEDYIIRITVERGREKYYCIPIISQKDVRQNYRGACEQLIYDSTEMLNQIILERKEKLL